MNYIKSSAKGTEKELRVYCLNDIHFGSESLDWKLWNKIKSDIRKNRENARIIINGDLFEMVTKASKGDLYEQKLSPKEQVDLAVEEFKEFADLIDLVISGNHGNRLTDISSIDPYELFCKFLGIKEKYGKYESVIGYSLNKNFYSMQVFHGTSGSSTSQGIINKMKKWKKTNCDIVYTGHFHRVVEEKYYEYKIDPYNHKVKKRKQMFLCGNCCVGHAPYAQRFGYEERHPSQAVLILSGKKNKWNFEVEWIENGTE